MIVPILVGPDILRRMLDTIDYPIKKLIIIDNGDALQVSRPAGRWITSSRRRSSRCPRT
jgi:hypothetical protein